MKTYTFYTDPSHGWLKVSRNELIAAGVAKLISNYSYQDSSNVYLEEDCDAGKFLHALKASGFEFKIAEKHTNSNSRIRNMQRFNS